MDLFSAFSTPPPQPSKKSEETNETSKHTFKRPSSNLEALQNKTSDLNQPDQSTAKKSKTVDSAIDQKLEDVKISQFLDSKLKELPNILVDEVEVQAGAGKNCKHEVCYFEKMGKPELKNVVGEAAKTYKFTLDPFQKQGVLCLENKQSVLISAHTSAGKTVIAEYAIAMALRDKQRVIYTSPIKALSNQKYRDLLEEFNDVGLMTGDITINPSASCLVMTTEILRSMLYKGSELMREVQFVIFDEIHYMRNAERGVVWEETIILLPDNVRYIFLSATIPNATQFASWITYLHKQPTNVVYTDYRPVPLQHYIYPEGGDGIHLVVDTESRFRADNFQAAMMILKDAAPSGSYRKKGQVNKSEDSSIFKLIKMIMENNFQPVIGFCFSKKACEENALQLSRLDFNDHHEKKLVEEVFENAIDCLSEDDKNLPQVNSILPCLKRGIGIHHGGLLPILKETVEILFQEGLLKCLFATETFSMGINAPARTVLFTDVEKFDGKDMRTLQAQEYIQMAGRAGRRNLDNKGIVIIVATEKFSESTAKTLLLGTSEPLNSAFHLTYNMVLNLLRVEEINPEYMLEKSFFQYQNICSIPEAKKKVEQAEEALAKHTVADNHMDYYKIREDLSSYTNQALKIIQKPCHMLPYLKPGRLLYIESQGKVFGWGVAIHFIERKDKEGNDIILVDTLVLCDKKSVKDCRGKGLMPDPPKSNNLVEGEMIVVPVTLDTIKKMSELVLYIPPDIRSNDARNGVFKSIEEVKKRYANNGPISDDVVPIIDPISDMNITDRSLKLLIDEIEKCEDKLYDHPLHDSKELPEIFKNCQVKVEAEQQLKNARSAMKKSHQLIKLDELKCRKKILRRLKYADEQDVIQLKGRVACEISTADELLLTELLFTNVFNDLTVAECCALLSCFVCERGGKDDEAPALQGKLKDLVNTLQNEARKIAKISNECKLEIEEDEYVDSFKTMLLDVVYCWSKGATFSKVTEMTDYFEGQIIRVIRRLEELLRDMANAAHIIGNPDLEKKFLDGITSIKRDIVFAASLYL